MDFIPISRKKRKTKSETFQNKKLLIDDSKATPVSNSPESRRYTHKCPYCYRTIRNVIFDAKIGLRTHWVWHCVISGTTKVDKLLEISNGVYVHHPDQLVPLEFLPSAYYRMSMYRKSCADGSNSSEKVCFIFSSINLISFFVLIISKFIYFFFLKFLYLLVFSFNISFDNV